MRRIFRGPRSRRTAGGWCGLVSALILLFPAGGIAEDRTGSERARLLGPLEKSLLVPGWGQLSEKRYLEGILFLAATSAALTGMLLNNHLGNENYALYQKAETLDEAVRTRRLAESFDTRRNQFFLAAAAVWAVNLLDIALIVNKKGGTDKSFSLRIDCGTKDHLGLTATCRF